MGKIALDATLRRRDDCPSAGIDDEIVLMDMAKARYYGLDPVASAIWNALSEPLTVAQLCARMAEAYQGDAATIQADVLAFLDDLAARELIAIDG